MLRIGWGQTEREKEQAGEILRLRAQVDDLQRLLHTLHQDHRRELNEQAKQLFDFLKPKSPELQPLPPMPVREYPGDRPSTSPPREGNLLSWARGEVPTAEPATKE